MRRFTVVACGRRWGKTELAKIMLIERAIRHQQMTWWLAPTYQIASQVWRDLKQTTRNLTGIKISESERRIDFHGGGMIAIRSAHQPDLLRGAGLDFVVLDEAAFMERSVWHEVIRPMLVSTQGGALFISTPFGLNWFHEIYQLGLNPAEPDWIAFHFRSQDNPLIPSAEFKALQRTTPERVWREEYLAEFVADAGRVFRGIERAVRDYQPHTPQPRMVMGVDWGREHDYTAIAVIDADAHQLVAFDRFNQISWQQQRARIQAHVRRWHPTVIIAEANSIGTVNIEALQAEGLPVRPFTMSVRTKAPLIEGLALAIETGTLGLLKDESLLAELQAYTLERLPAGGYRYSAPTGAHDDGVIALALAWYGVQHGGVSFDFV